MTLKTIADAHRWRAMRALYLLANTDIKRHEEILIEMGDCCETSDDFDKYGDFIIAALGKNSK